MQESEGVYLGYLVEGKAPIVRAILSRKWFEISYQGKLIKEEQLVSEMDLLDPWKGSADPDLFLQSFAASRYLLYHLS